MYEERQTAGAEDPICIILIRGGPSVEASFSARANTCLETPQLVMDRDLMTIGIIEVCLAAELIRLSTKVYKTFR